MAIVILKEKKLSKYNNKRIVRYGINFQSIKEADYYDKLLIRHRGSDIKFFLRQVPFHLPGNTKYIADYMVAENDGTIRFIDIKGFQTAIFKLKKKQVEAIYRIKIEII